MDWKESRKGNQFTPATHTFLQVDTQSSTLLHFRCPNRLNLPCLALVNHWSTIVRRLISMISTLEDEVVRLENVGYCCVCQWVVVCYRSFMTELQLSFPFSNNIASQVVTCHIHEFYKVLQLCIKKNHNCNWTDNQHIISEVKVSFFGNEHYKQLILKAPHRNSCFNNKVICPFQSQKKMPTIL